MRALRRLAIGFGSLLAVIIAIAAAPEYFPDHGLIHSAILAGDPQRVQLLLDRGGDPNSRRATLSELSRYLMTTTRSGGGGLPALGKQPPLLSIAIYSRQPVIARMLIKAGAAPNARDARGYTPLSYAALSDDPGLVRLLLDRGANAKLNMPDGSTALREGAAFNYRMRPAHPEIIQMLEEATR